MSYCCVLIGRAEENLDIGRFRVYQQGDPFCLMTMLINRDPYRKTALFLVHGYNPNELCDLQKVCRYRSSPYFEPFIRCLFAAGYRPTESDYSEIAEFTCTSSHMDLLENWPRCKHCTENHGQKVLEDCVNEKIKTLKQLCSLCIRSQLRRACQGRSILNSITQLPIPEPLQYLYL